MKKESVQQKLSRIRPPRVQITYDVQVGEAMVMKELPFVVGVMGDYSGQPAEPLGRVRDRGFVQIDRDNFDRVMAGMKPRLVLRVPNKLSAEGGSMSVELNFESMDGFHPDQLVQQVEPLRKLVELRQNLNDLLSKMDGNEKLGNILEDVMKNTQSQQQLGAELGLPAGDGGTDKKED